MISVLYDLIYMIPVGVAAVYAAESYAGLSAPGPAGYMVMMLTVGICLAMRYFESRVKYLIPGMLTTIAAGIVLIREKDERAGFLISCSWILWIALTGIACYLLCRLITRYIWVRRGFSLLLILMLLIMMLRGAEGGKAVVALIFLPLLSSAAEEVQLYWDKSGYTDRKGHIVSLVPFLLIVCIAVYLLPSSDRPYDWGFVKRICEGAEELARRTADLIHFKDEDYGAVIGFSDESGFAGSLERKTENVMTLRCEGEAPEAVYLAGKTFDTFDGREWTSSYTGENNDRIKDTLETLGAVKAYDPEGLSDYLKRTDIGIDYLEFRTRYLFAPLKMLPGTVRPEKPGYVQKGGDLISKKRLSHGSSFSLSYYRMNQEQDGFREMTMSVKPEQTEEYLEYRSRIYRYCLPKTQISDRAREYLEEATIGCNGDLERLERLESLLGAYSYSTASGGLPDEVDSEAGYLDYLLFESRQGYCSHFATAFVLMARSMGIPARYVQGFRVADPVRGTVTVTSDMAHAWPEAYIDGVGWLSFEPTPGMKRSSSWGTGSRKKESVHTIYDKKPDVTISGDEAFEGEDEGEGRHPEPGVIVLPLLLCLVFLICFTLMDRMLSRRRYERMPEDRKFEVLCRRNMRILKAMGYTKGSAETLQEFRERAGADIPAGDLRFTECMERVRYAGRTADSEMLDIASANEKALLAGLRRERGRLYYMLYRIWGAGLLQK